MKKSIVKRAPKGASFVSWLAGVLPLLVLLVLLGTGCSSNVGKARELAATGQFDLAIQLLEQELKDHPSKVAVHHALADTYLGKAVAFKNGKAAADAATLLDKAIQTYEGALKLEPDDGVLLGKHAFALRIRNDDRSAPEALKAWRAGKKEIALAALGRALPTSEKVDDPAATILREVSWSVSDWKQLPAWEALKTQWVQVFVVKADGVRAAGAEADIPEVSLPRFSIIGPNITIMEDHIEFGDQGRPIFKEATAWVRSGICPQDWNTCQTGALNRQLYDIDKNRLWSGPCWLACVVGTHAHRVPTSRLRADSERCIEAPKGTDGCPIRYEYAIDAQRRIKAVDAVPWPIQEDSVYGKPHEGLAQIAKVAPPEVLTHLLNGEVGKGLPTAAVAALLGTLVPGDIVVSETTITATVKSGQLTFVFENGRLASWQAPEPPAKATTGPASAPQKGDDTLLRQMMGEKPTGTGP